MLSQSIDPDRYRPQIHYSPPAGFMNDPNGLVYHDGEYHLFHQLNPFDVRAGRVHWGHAVSRDLLRWTTLPLAIPETAAGQAFSGSAVVDAEDTSGLFGGPPGGLVAVYTRASPDRQTQEIAFSRDAGRTFQAYPANPVLDVASNSFRDPKVFYHRESGRWVMAVVRARQHRVLFYGSPDLRDWTELGAFATHGVLGVDYECPDLVELPVEGGDGRTKWVLFVSINPGAPQGGSTVQWFVGAFDGRQFIPDDAVTRFVDFGKDFYALQTYAGLPVDRPVAVAWLSNWQYANETPTGSWRGVMSLPRQLALRQDGDDWQLVQTPVALDALRDRVLLSGARPAGTDERFATPVPPGVALMLRVRLTLDPDAVAAIRFANGDGEYLDIGYDAGARQLFVDRGGARGFAHRFFTDKFSSAAPSSADPGAVDLLLVFDRCTLELFAFGGVAACSVLHFFAAPADRVVLDAVGHVAVDDVELCTLASAYPDG